MINCSLYPLSHYSGTSCRFADAVAPLLDGRRVFIEPFCGGASLSFHYLYCGLIDKAFVNDLSPFPVEALEVFAGHGDVSVLQSSPCCMTDRLIVGVDWPSYLALCRFCQSFTAGRLFVSSQDVFVFLDTLSEVPVAPSDAVIFLDPPYLSANSEFYTVSSGDYYAGLFSIDDMQRLIKKGEFLRSRGFRVVFKHTTHLLLDSVFRAHGWSCVSFTAHHMNCGHPIRTCFWFL